MMSILIKGMEMPSDEIGQCGYKNIRIWYDGTIEELNGYHVKEASYKVAPVPPHGRLIDADNLLSVLDILCDKGGDIRYWEQLAWIIKDCPTIIEAEVDDGDS